ncbi:MAG: hypothetical protein QXV54_05030 [Desulfurococcaceae archaeon]
MKSSIVYSLLVLLLIFTNIYASIISVHASPNNWIILDSSFSSSTGGKVYPGSRNAKLTIIARYAGDHTALNPVACVDVSSGFSIVGPRCVAGRDADNNAMHIVEPGNTTYFVFSLNVDRSVSPGIYTARLNITYYIAGTNELSWDLLYVTLEVSQYPPLNIVIKETYLTPYDYPGACPVNVIIGILNNGETSIISSRFTLELPPEMADPSELNYTYASRVDPGSEVYLNLGTTCINPSAVPSGRYTGILHVDAQLSTDDGVVYNDKNYYYVDFSIGEIPKVKISVINYELTSKIGIPGLKNTGLRVTIRSEEQGTLTLTYSEISLENAVAMNSSTTAIYTHNIVLNYLESTWITYNELSILENASYIKANITVYGSATRQGVEYPVTFKFSLLIPLSEKDVNIVVERIEWSNGHAYPNSTGNTLIVALLNNDPNVSIVDAIVELKTVTEVIYPRKLVAYNIVLNPGTLVEVSFTNIIVLGTVEPGVYDAVINITGILRGQDNSYRLISLSRKTVLVIDDPSVLKPVLPILEIVESFWGEGSPQYIYPGNARAALTIVLRNNGTITASNVIVLIDSVNPDDVSVLNNASVCSIQLAPGSTCNAIFYLNLTKSSSGIKIFNLKVQFGVQEVGINTLFTQQLVTSIYLPEYQAGGSVVVANYGWLNNNPVFPRTKGAVLNVNLANLEAYSIYSTWVTLTTPDCMSVRNGTPSTVYIAGPVATLQTTTLSFTIDLNNCKAGIHQAVLEIDYYVQTAGGGTRKKSLQLIHLFVDSDYDSIEYVTSGWVNTPVTPPVYGAQFYIVLRNAKYPSITNPILKLNLPKGVTESKTNSSEPALTPALNIPLQQAYLIQGAQSNIAQLISQYMQQSQMVTSVNKGDFMVFSVTLNIESVNTTVLYVPFTLEFIDHWGNEYSYSSQFAINILTTPPMLEIRPVTPLIAFRNGTAIVDILVENKYSTPISNLYLALIPTSNNVIPQNAIRYIGKLEGCSNTTVRFEVVYNPLQITMGTVPVSMSSAVFTATLIFVDVAGALHTINTTLAVMIKPFIELTLLPTTVARYSKDTLIVNGIVANTGISTARSVIAYIKYGSAEAFSIIGDVDPASQTPFRLEIKAPYVGDNCTLIIRYRDEYGSEYVLETPLEVTQIVEQTVTATTQPTQTDIAFKIAIVVLIAVFLVALFFVLYRHSKQVMKRVIHETE